MSQKFVGGINAPFYEAQTYPFPIDLLIVGGGGAGMYGIDTYGGGGGQIILLKNFTPPTTSTQIHIGAGAAGWTSNGYSNPSSAFGIIAAGGLHRGGGQLGSNGPNGPYIPEFSAYGASGYFGGGGGGGYTGSGGGLGGLGGGGHGGDNSATYGNAEGGTANTGGGGGGGNQSSNASGGGGSGVVAIRYPTVYPALTTTVGTVSTSTTNGYRYYVWTASGYMAL